MLTGHCEKEKGVETKKKIHPRFLGLEQNSAPLFSQLQKFFN